MDFYWVWVWLISCDSDQGMHTDFACLLFSDLKRRLHPDTVECIITQADIIERGFLSGLSLSSSCPSHNNCLSRYSPYWPRWHEHQAYSAVHLP
ncbi:hypothetical protein BDR04DRAFT_1104558 [Suillus decipiens]|nr:hypothetical protein BDR04DRAFT_1104558 [Suillus decipiens]